MVYYDVTQDDAVINIDLQSLNIRITDFAIDKE